MEKFADFITEAKLDTDIEVAVLTKLKSKKLEGMYLKFFLLFILFNLLIRLGWSHTEIEFTSFEI